MDRGAWRATVLGVTKSWTGLSDQYLLSLLKVALHSCTALLRNAVFICSDSLFSSVVIDCTQLPSQPS